MISQKVVFSCLRPIGLNKVNHVRNHVPMRFPLSYDLLPFPSGSFKDLDGKRRAENLRFLFINFAIFSGLLAFTLYTTNFNKYTLPKKENTEEGLRFLKTDKKLLKYVLEN